MATEAITPEVTAPVASPSEGAAPSTPVSTPSTPSTPVAAPVTPEAPITDGAAFLREKAAKLNIPGVERPEVVKTPEQIEAEQKVAAEVKAAADAKAAEEAAGKTEEQKAAEKAKEDPAKPAVNPLDKMGALPAEKIGEALKSPEFVAACEKAGIDPALLPETARMAAEAEMFREIVPTPEAAKFAVENADHFYQIEEKFPAIKDAATLDDFVTNVMLPLSLVRDAQGNPIPDPENPGAFKTDGSVSRFMSTTVDYDHQWTAKIAQTGAEAAEKAGNEEVAAYFTQLQEAIKFLDEFRQNGYKMPTGQKPPEMAPEQKAEFERLQARDREVTQQQAQVHQQQIGLIQEGINTDTIAGTQPQLSETLNATSLDDYGKTKAGEDIWKAALDKLKSQTSYQRLKDSYYDQITLARKHAKTDADFQTAAKGWYDRIVTLNTTTMRNILYGPKGVVQEVLDKAGARRMSAQQQRDQKIAGQIKNDTMNAGVKTAGSTNAAKAPTGDELFDKAKELARVENGGREPDGAQILRAKMKLLQSKSA